MEVFVEIQSHIQGGGMDSGFDHGIEGDSGDRSAVFAHDLEQAEGMRR